MHTVPRVCPSQWWELVRVFLTLGALSPSGPGLTGVLQTEVQEKRGWLSQARFVEGVALVNALALGLTPLGIVPLLLLAGALGVVLYGSRPWGVVATTVMAALQGVLVWSPPWLHLPALSGWASSPGARPSPPGLGQIGLFFAKVGLFTFGGDLVLLAFLQDQVVQHLQWLTPQAVLDGLALGRLTPGPIPMLAAFIGYKVAGLGGAVVAGGAVLFPSVLLVLRLPPLLGHPPRLARLCAAPPGINPSLIRLN